MKVTPKTEKEIYESDLLPDGWYPFTVAKAEEKTSKKGNEMIEMSVKVYRGEGFSFVTEYLMDNDFSARKLRHLAETCDLLEDYEAAGLNADDLAGKEGYELENKTSTQFAAMQIYKASSPIKVSPPRFFESNEVAMKDIERCAEEEVNSQSLTNK